MEAQSALDRLLHEAGIRKSVLAAKLQIDKSNITRWSQRRVPAEWVLRVERETGISRSQLRPDLYPAPAE